MSPSLRSRSELRPPFLAEHPGELPHDGPAIVGGITVAPGHRCASTEAGQKLGPAGVLWASDTPLGDAGPVCLALQGCFAGTGLWPVILEELHGDEGRPWDTGEFGHGDPTRIDAVNLLDVFEELWEAIQPDPTTELDHRDPALVRLGSEFPGFATDRSPMVDREAIDTVMKRALSHVVDERIGLVPARRPADVLAVLDWRGARSNDADTWEYSAVLRSWEDRFGAVLVGIGLDTLEIAVAAPPDDLASALAIAVEHAAVCPDGVWQTAGSIEGWAEQILGAHVWSLGWDRPTLDESP